jgi:uncharacterized membrane protein
MAVALNSTKQTRFQKYYPYLLIIAATIGLIAAFILTLEKMALLKDPNFQPTCNINPILSCGSIIRTPQAAAFGFPNPFIGLAGYAVIITVGMALLAGATFKRWFWLGLQGGTVMGLLFTHWLIYQSLYSIGALCIYCMAVWVVTIALFWYTLLYNLRSGYITTPKSLVRASHFAQRHHLDILIGWYVLILALILNRFWYFWITLI